MQIQPETIIWNTPPSNAKSGRGQEVFRLEKTTDDRINGSIPVWGRPTTAEETITSNLAQASNGEKTPDMAVSLTETAPKKDDSFGFLDLVDMVNPLQHIPIISTLYRNLTGDTIKPVSEVVGGAAFGGPIGAVAGIVNAFMQIETGKDVGDNMLASIKGDESTVARPDTDTTIAHANLSVMQRHYNS